MVRGNRRKYKLGASVLNYWRRKYLSNGKDGLKSGFKRVELFANVNDISFNTVDFIQIQDERAVDAYEQLWRKNFLQLAHGHQCDYSS